MQNLAYYNGRITPIDEMMIPANDRGFYFGDGVYEAAMAYGRRIFALGDHLERMENSARKLRIALPQSAAKIGALLEELSAQVDSPNQFLYWQITRGAGPRNHLFPEGAAANLYAYVKPWGQVQMADDYRVITVEDTRFFHCDIKTLNLIPNVMAAQRAQEAGCQEAVFVRDGWVTESSHANVSILKDGVFITHPLDNLVLPGTERKHMIAYCGRLGIPVSERAFTVAEMMAADEIILSSTSHPSMRVAQVDGQPVGLRDPERVARLRACYLAEIGQ